ncbi:MAG TPA: N-acetylneuraminate synthase, partial [Gammaproteobacteria bacterium]|nr:N-acetylneuraminate synthase [Gammaproteobacteria bacterium]
MQIELADRQVGPGHPCFIIAEAGVNHNGEIGLAKQLVDVAAEAGADAIKFQTFRADRGVSAATPKAKYQLQTTDASESQREMLRHLELSREAHHQLQAHCQEQNILFMSTPFDQESADLLDELRVPLFKIGSGEITNWPFLEYVARKGKPIILSTGMSYLSEVD